MIIKRTLTCVSWCDADNVMNYGQILQGCAMMYVLRNTEMYRINYVSFLPRTIKERLKYYIDHYNPFSGHLFAYFKTQKLILKFIHKNKIHFYQIGTRSILERIGEKSDILVCGSDQIWHPQNYNECYFLNFGNRDAIRISYGASLPKTRIEEQYKKQYRFISANLHNFDYISIREKNSIGFLETLSEKNVSSVLDPTFLVPNKIWRSCEERVSVPSDYIFVYIPNGMDYHFTEFVKKIQTKLRVKKILVMITRGKNYFSESTTLPFVSAGQFLYLIDHASCVITSSFHAVVFSIIFHKKFWCYDVPNEARGEDNRLLDLIQKVKITDRVLNNTEEICDKPIDYNAIENMLSEMRKESLDFLNKALSI